MENIVGTGKQKIKKNYYISSEVNDTIIRAKERLNASETDIVNQVLISFVKNFNLLEKIEEKLKDPLMDYIELRTEDCIGEDLENDNSEDYFIVKKIEISNSRQEGNYILRVYIDLESRSGNLESEFYERIKTNDLYKTFTSLKINHNWKYKENLKKI